MQSRKVQRAAQQRGQGSAKLFVAQQGVALELEAADHDGLADQWCLNRCLGGWLNLQALLVCLLVALNLLLQGAGAGLGLGQQIRWNKQDGQQRRQ